MSTHAQFYLTRAAIARELADGSQLDNVRESHLRAAEAWDGFAARATKADQMRADELKRKSPGSNAVQSDLVGSPVDPREMDGESDDSSGVEVLHA